MNIVDLNRGQLSDLIQMMESHAFVKLFMKILETRQDSHINHLVMSNDEQVRGAIKELTWVASIHDRCVEEISRLELENVKESSVDEIT